MRNIFTLHGSIAAYYAKHSAADALMGWLWRRYRTSNAQYQHRYY